nr:hypothetical protein 2 [Desulfobacteraceae bacterium]
MNTLQAKDLSRGDASMALTIVKSKIDFLKVMVDAYACAIGDSGPCLEKSGAWGFHHILDEISDDLGSIYEGLYPEEGKSEKGGADGQHPES